MQYIVTNSDNLCQEYLLIFRNRFIGEQKECVTRKSHDTPNGIQLLPSGTIHMRIVPEGCHQQQSGIADGDMTGF